MCRCVMTGGAGASVQVQCAGAVCRWRCSQCAGGAGAILESRLCAPSCTHKKRGTGDEAMQVQVRLVPRPLPNIMRE